MPLSSSKLPADDVRLIQFEDTVFKVKLTYDSGDGGVFLPCSRSQLNHQVEQVLRAVLYAKQFDALKIKTEHFYVDCSMYKWEALRLIAFKKNSVRLNAGPFVIALRFKPHGLHATSGNGHSDRQEVAQKVNRHRQVREQRPTERQVRRSPRVHQLGKDREISPDEPPPDTKQQSEQRNQEAQTGSRVKTHSRQRNSSSSESEEKNPKKKSKQPERKKHRTSFRESSDSDSEIIQQRKKRLKSSHRPPLQFVDASPKVLRINLGTRVTDEDLRRHQGASSVNDSGHSAGDHTGTRRKGPLQLDLGSEGEGSHKVKKSPQNARLDRSRTPSPLHTRAQESSDYNKNPHRTHTMATRPKPKTPPKNSRQRRRSSFSGYLEDFLDHFW